MRLQREKGSAGVEFALLLPIIVLLVFGMMEVGVALYDVQIIKNASREGARAGIINVDPKPTELQIEDVVKTYLTNASLDLSKLKDIVVDGEGGASGEPLTVTVIYAYDFNVLPGLITDFAGSIDLQGSVVMRNE